MANYVLPIVPVTRRLYPDFIADNISKGLSQGVNNETDMYVTKKGLLLTNNTAEQYTYISFASELPKNSIEVLLRLNRTSVGANNFVRTNGVFLSGSGALFPRNSIELSLPSGPSTNTVYASVYAADTTNHYFNKDITGINSPNVDFTLRIRVSDNVVSVKIWRDIDGEPTDWLSVSNHPGLNVTNFGYFFYGDSLRTIIKDVAYATNGDSATFHQDVIDVVAGTVLGAKVGDVVNIHEVATHNIINSIELHESGAWQADIYNNRPVYARIERANGSEYDLLFAKYGNTYLGGDYPDGAIKDDGVPSTGEVSILYKSDDPILGGVTIAKVSAAQSGEWRVSGLQPNVPFDVVARKPNRKDVVVSGVMGVTDPEFKFTLMGSVSYVLGHIKGFLLAKGAAAPMTAQFAGILPYGLSSSSISVEDNILSIDAPMRDYGAFYFIVDVTDNNGKTVSSPIVITDGERAPFVDFIGAVNSMDRGSGSAPITTVVPNSVQEGDMLVLAVMRRGNITVSDNNGGSWTLGEDVFSSDAAAPQGTSIYYRTAKAGDAGKTVTVSATYSGRLIVYLSVYRGKFAPLKVAKTVTNPARYDDTYKNAVKNLAPIEHDSGFIVRAVSQPYAATAGTSTAVVANMINTGDTNRPSSNPIRLQVAYKHLSKPGVLDGITYDTSSASADEVILDVAIILDEVRP